MRVCVELGQWVIGDGYIYHFTPINGYINDPRESHGLVGLFSCVATTLETERVLPWRFPLMPSFSYKMYPIFPHLISCGRNFAPHTLESVLVHLNCTETVL